MSRLEGSPGLAERRAAVDAAIGALQDLSTTLHQVPSGALGELAGTLGQLAALATAGVVQATAEAEQRGVISQSQCASTSGWVRDQVWHLLTGGSAVVARCAAIMARPDLTVLADAIRSTDITPTVAITVAAEYDTLAPDLVDGAGPVVLDAMINVGAEHGTAAVRGLREMLLTRYGREGLFQDEQDTHQRSIDLSTGKEQAGIFRYELTLDREGHAVLEAAIGPLSKPQPGPDAEPDPRPVGRRRGQALIELCRRAVAAGDRAPSATKTQLHVTITLDDLRAAAGAATVVGSAATDCLLGPETARKLACDAGIVPVVLGTDSEILDVGRTHRLFTPGQLKALWLRDRHCTFPGCQIPAHWTDAHHLWHWIDGGPTDLNNAALLCGRHHTVVHRDHLAGAVVDGHVLWDRKPGSYQQQPVTHVG
ncbi:MAG: DUF222 domain-containing protein [Nakamurella sp.]